jgi:hypothetical protein
MFVHFDESIFILFVACFECTSFEETSHFDCEVVEIWEEASTSYVGRCDANLITVFSVSFALLLCSTVMLIVRFLMKLFFLQNFWFFLRGPKMKLIVEGGGVLERQSHFQIFFDILLYLYYIVGNYWVMKKVSVKMKT